MAVLEFNAPAQQPRQAQRSMPFGNQPATYANGEKPKSQLWLDVGRTINGEFVSLPLGQGIDTMYPREVRGQDETFVKRVNAQNQLLSALQKLGMKFEPGEDRSLNLEVRLRRVNAPLEVTTNEFIIDPSTLLGDVEDTLLAE